MNRPLSIGRVALTVRDLDRVSRFYQDVVGFRLLSSDAASVRLGTGSRVLLELRQDSQARLRSPRDAGLYHVAFLLPSRSDLGCFYKHALSRRLNVRTSDHAVSESVYFVDPEGNGIELCADRPSSDWKWDDGTVEMTIEWLNIESLLESASGREWRGLPEGTVVGHLNLQVGDLSAADAFYAGVLGFGITCRLPGASFFASGGYHHHIATNIWNSSGAPKRPDPVTGLADIEVIAAGAAVLDAIRSRIAPPLGITVRDPWGTSITLSVAG
nr:VOC family protein [uncultured Rhodopila sp.]